MACCPRVARRRRKAVRWRPYAPAVDPKAAHRAATTAGLVTFPIGLALLVAPKVGRVAGLTANESRAIGIVDLTLSVGLLAGRPRWPWAGARAAANLLTSAVLARTGTPLGRAASTILILLTVLDAAAARSLRASGS